MARVDSTGGTGYVVDNGTGLAVRTKLNQIAAAINSLNSGSGDPSINTAFQPHIDTSTSLLRIRNAANNAYVSLGNISLENFGHANLATANTFTARQTFSVTTSITVPVGTTAQRDGSPANGMLRYNSTLNAFEGYANNVWGEIGGGGARGGGTDKIFYESDTNVTTNYTITSGKNAHTVRPGINSGITVTVPSGSLLVIL